MRRVRGEGERMKKVWRWGWSEEVSGDESTKEGEVR